MAKKISTETVPQAGQTAEGAGGTENVAAVVKEQSVPEMEQAPLTTPLPEEKKKTGDKEAQNTETKADAGVLEILKKFPAYPALYVDVHGGVYTPDTPPLIRREAILYNNPYYNEPETK